VATLTADDIENISPFEVFVKNNKEKGLDYPSKILTGYSFSVYKERLIELLGTVEKEIMTEVKTALKITFDLNNQYYSNIKIQYYGR